MTAINKKNIDQQKKKTILISNSVHESLSKYCSDQGYVMGRTVERLIVDYLEREKQASRALVDMGMSGNEDR